MKILHLVHQYPPEQVGGTERYTQNLATYQAQMGHEVGVVVPSAGSQSSTPQQEAGVWVYRLPAGGRGATAVFLQTFYPAGWGKQLQQIFHQFQPEIIHIQHLMGWPSQLYKLLTKNSAKVVLTLHDYWWVCANAQLLTNYDLQLCEGPDKYLNCGRCVVARANRPSLRPAAPLFAPLLAWRNRQLHHIGRLAKLVIAPAGFVADWYEKQQLGFCKAIVVPHGLELPAGLQNKQGETTSNRPLRLLYVGGLSYQKGVHVVVQAVAPLGEQVQLTIVGNEQFDPVYSEQLRQTAGANTYFLGKQQPTAVYHLMAEADVVLVPSLWYETFVLVISEAFGLGVPVLASRLGVLADRVQDGINGRLLPAGEPQAWQEAIQQLLDQPEQLAQLRQGVRPGWSLAEHGDYLLQLYQTVL